MGSMKDGSTNRDCSSDDRGPSVAGEYGEISQGGATSNEEALVGEAHEGRASSDQEGGATVRVPDGGWGWMVVLGAGINSLLFGAMMQTIGIFYLQIREKYNVSASCAVWVGGLFQLFSGLGSPVAAWLVQKYSSRSVAFFGTIINCSGILATSYAPNIQVVFFTFGIVPGIGTCLLHTASYLHVGTYFDKKKARALALTSVNQGLGGLIFAPIAVLLHNEYRLSGTFFILAAVFTHSFISAALFRPLTSKSNNTTIANKKKNLGSRARNGQGHHSKESTFKTALRDQSTEPLCSETLSSQSGHVICSSCPPNQSGLTDLQNNHTDQSKTVSEITNVNGSAKHAEYCQQKDHVPDHDQEEDASYLQQGQKKNQLAPCSSGNVGDKSGTPASVPKKKRFLSMFTSVMSIEYAMLCLSMFSSLSATASATQFIPALALERELNMSQGATIISVSGVAFVIGALILGSLLDVPVIRPHRLFVYAACIFITGLCTMVLPLGQTLIAMSVPLAFGSAAAAVVYTQIVTALSDLLGRENVPAGFGLLRIAGALGAITGRAVGGILVDVFGQNSLAFYIFGALPVFSSLLLLLTLVRWRRKKASLSSSGLTSPI